MQKILVFHDTIGGILLFDLAMRKSSMLIDNFEHHTFFEPFLEAISVDPSVVFLDAQRNYSLVENLVILIRKKNPQVHIVAYTNDSRSIRGCDAYIATHDWIPVERKRLKENVVKHYQLLAVT